MGKKLTTESMIERFRSRHGDTYDYSNVDSDSRDEKGRVRIICPIHGEFLQTPMNHIRGKGCPLCFGTHKKNTNDVISEIKSRYGDKYIIPNDFVYISNKASFNMICKKHGEWSTTYSRLITKGCGCKKCSCTMYDTELFIHKISKIYGESFNYDELEFNGFRNKVTVKCKECGKKLFFSPSVLLNGTAKCDCSTKKQSKLEIDIDNALKTNGLEYIPQYKASWLRLIEP